VAWLFVATVLLSMIGSAAPAQKIPDPKAVFSDAVAVWHLGDLSSADGKSPLKLHGAAKVGVELAGTERAASLAHGGDGKAAEIGAGHWGAGQGVPFELKPGEPLRLRVFLDRSVLEVFANGRQCLTQRIYPTCADSLGIKLISRSGSVKVKSLDAWDLSPANSL
jgi:hypothetical protein